MKRTLLLRKRSLSALVFSTVLLLSMFINISALPLIPLLNPSNAFPQFPETMFTGEPSAGESPVADPLANIDTNLHSWVKTSVVPGNLRQLDGAVSVILGATYKVNLDDLSQYMRIRNVFHYPIGYMIQGLVSSPKALFQIDQMPNTGVIMGDQILERDEAPGNEDPTTNQYWVQHIIQNDLVQANYPGFDGTGVTIGICDTGTDFGVTDLSTAYATNSSGYPTSFDPGGMGLAITSYALPSVGGYLHTEGLDFTMWLANYDAGVTGFRGSNSTYELYAEDMFVGGYGGIVSKSGFYKIGMSVQVGTGVARNFFVFILVDETTPFLYDTLYIDWETSWALTADYNGISTSVAADWDFTDNEPHRWGDGTEVLAVDLDGDHVNDFSMGSLSNTLDYFEVINGELVSGIDSLGRGFAIMWDQDGHGTYCAGSAAGRGIQTFDVFGNGTLKSVPGVAPGAKVMALKLFSFGDFITTWFWGSGYRPKLYPYSLYYEWDHCGYWGWDSSNQAHILSNSWGFRGLTIGPTPVIWGCDWYSTTVDFLTTGGLITDPNSPGDWYNATGWGWVDYSEPDYTFGPDTAHTIAGEIMPAPLFVISTGNAGPGYGTSGSPASISSLMVGASTTAHYATPTYNNDSSLGPQPYDQIADFSSNGPMPQGMVKPDVVAVGAYAFDIAPLHEGLGNGNDSWIVFGGTSQASPIAAGVAALVFQALGWDGEENGIVKSIIMQGADDLGQPAFRQGAGRVNAWKSLNIAFDNDTLTGGADYLPTMVSDYTFAHWGDMVKSTWWRQYYVYMYAGVADPFQYGETYFHPGQIVTWYDAGFHTYSILQGGNKAITLTAELPSGAAVDSVKAQYYTLLSESTKTLRTNSTYSTYSLFADGHFDKTFMNQFMTEADYAVIYLSYPRANFEDLYALSGQANYVFLHDWNDTNLNGFIDLHSLQSKGEVRRVMYDYSVGNVHQIHVGKPGAQWLGNRNATIFYHDVGVELFLWRHLDVTMTIRLYQLVDWPWISVAPAGGNDYTATVTVPADADLGFYDGFINVTKGTITKLFPISVRVDGKVAPGSSLTWGETTGLPYDNGAITGALNWDGRYASGEWRFYMIDVTGISNTGNNRTSYVMTNVTWSDPETCIDVYAFITAYGAQTYFVQGDWISDTEWIADGRWSGTPSWERQNVLLTDMTWYQTGAGAQNQSWTSRAYFMVVLHVSHIGGSFVPENFTVTVTPVQYYQMPGNPHELAGATGTLVCSSVVGNPVVTDDSVWSHTHITFNGTFDSYGLPGLPTVQIRQTDLMLLKADVLEIEAIFTAANCTPNTAAGGPYDAVFDFPGIGVGALIDIHMELNPDPGDPPADLELFLINPDGVTIASSTRAGSVEDITGVVTTAAGDYQIGVDYWGVDVGSNYYWGGWPGGLPFKVSASASAITHNINDGLSAEADTHVLGLNTAVDLLLKGITGTSLDWHSTVEVKVTNVTVTNFFAPTLTVTAPNGGEVFDWEQAVTITWTASDLNLDEELAFSVEVSNDNGANWRTIVYGTTLNTATWTPSSTFYGLPPSTQCLVRVTAADGMFTVSDTSNAVFTTRKASEPVPPPLELYTVIIVAVLVVVILLTTCLLKRRQTRAK